MSLPVLKIAVVGHTNVGKTSLMRTLTRDVDFGEVSDRPATTRRVEGTGLFVDGRKVLELYDTPGLEDSIGLLDYLDAERGDRRVEGIKLIKAFLASPDAKGRFAQEAKGLRQVLASDIALYVIDVRDRVLAKHRDELEILARCAKPVVPVLNFTASPVAKTAMWRQHLSRANMHAVAEFDTVVIDEVCEQRLYEKMMTLLDGHRGTLTALIADRRRERAVLIKASAEAIADLLIDAAAYVLSVPALDPDQKAAVEALKQKLRAREQGCVDQLLDLHRFRADDYLGDELPITGGEWGVDLFSAAALKRFGVQAGGAAAAGAVVGAVMDAMAGGALLGAGTVLGATLGGVIGAARAHGKRLIHRARGMTELHCDDATLRLLAVRQVLLAQALFRRGHASQTPIDMKKKLKDERFEALAGRTLPPALAKARTRSQWSRLGDRPAAADPARQSAQHEVAGLIEAILVRPPV